MSPRFLRFLSPLIVCLGCCGLVCCSNITGCTPRSSKSKSGKPAQDTRSKQVADILASAVTQLQPQNLGLNSDTASVAGLLNSWKEMRLLDTRKVTFPESVQREALPPGFLIDSEWEEHLRQGFDSEDLRYTRDCYLAKEITDQATSAATSDLERVVLAFEYVVRNVALVSSSDELPPMRVFEALVLGRGHASERILAFSALLRQLRIDCVLLGAPESADEPLDGLVGVLLDGQVYLFDPLIGLPIPRPATGEPASTDAAKAADSTALQRPATLDEVLADPSVLAALAVRSDQPYRLTGPQLTAGPLLIVEQRQAWAPRMLFLEQALPADQVTILADPLDDRDGQPGLLTRIRAGHSSWSTRPIAPWTVGRATDRMLSSDDPQVFEEITRAFQPLQAPVTIAIDPNTGEARVNQQSNEMMTRRIMQLRGLKDDAVTGYVIIRNAIGRRMGVPLVERIHALAYEHATYWTAVCKYESGDYKDALETLGDYFKRTRQPHWEAAGRHLMAKCHAQLGNWSAAISELERRRSREDTYREANAILIRRWQPLAAAADKSKPAEATPPATEPDASSQPPATDAPPSDAQPESSSTDPKSEVEAAPKP